MLSLPSADPCALIPHAALTSKGRSCIRFHSRSVDDAASIVERLCTGWASYKKDVSPAQAEKRFFTSSVHSYLQVAAFLNIKPYYHIHSFVAGRLYNVFIFDTQSPLYAIYTQST